VVEHQQNHIRITNLRQATQDLEERRKSHIRTLVALRQELLAIPAFELDPASRPSTAYTVDDVLAYAKYISRTTVAPTFRPKPQPLASTSTLTNGAAATSYAANPADDTPFAHPAHGIATPPSGRLSSPPPLPEDTGATEHMTGAERTWLDPRTHHNFEPWPSYDAAASGGLAALQRLRERGVDPATVRTAAEEAEWEAKKKEEEEKERREQEERERRRASMFDTGRARAPGDDVFDPDA
jgi:hypothetical protein